LNYSPAYSDGDSFRAVVRSEFFQDVLDMSFDCFFGDEEDGRYIAISISSGYLL
jgi:hypothetical protein